MDIKKKVAKMYVALNNQATCETVPKRVGDNALALGRRHFFQQKKVSNFAETLR